jgi:hypothetical protein
MTCTAAPSPPNLGWVLTAVIIRGEDNALVYNVPEVKEIKKEMRVEMEKAHEDQSEKETRDEWNQAICLQPLSWI